jgi:hypothetical protein
LSKGRFGGRFSHVLQTAGIHRPRPGRIIFCLVFGALVVLGGSLPVWSEEATMRAKQFPTSYFYRYNHISIAAKEKVLTKIVATLKELNRNGYGLIAKGAVLGKFTPEIKTYEKLTILDESGLIIIAHRVPNLYYRYPGQAGINPNIYLIIKRVRVNVPESYIRYGYVVEGDYVAYVQKFVNAIMEGLERAAHEEDRLQAPPPR